MRARVVGEIASSGKSLPVLFEERRGEYWYGHSHNFAEVMVLCERELHGEIADVLPERVENGIIIGKIL